MLSGIELSLLALFLAGIQSSPHCALMCSGLNVSSGQQALHWSQVQTLRVLSYALLGMLAGWLGSYLLLWMPLHLAPDSWRLLIGTGLIAMAIGFHYRRHTPACPAKRKPRRNRRWLALGWGLIPCPALYAALSVAVFSGHPWNGFMLMLAFALGTLPMHGLQLLLWKRLGLNVRMAGTIPWRSGLIALNGLLIIAITLYLPANSSLFCFPQLQ